MKFHNITTADMMNGDGLRTVLWLSGCEMKCENCQNPQTWDPNVGIDFDDVAKEELFEKLSKEYIAGITFSGGHPLHEANCEGVLNLIKEIREKFPNKNIWLYTGYTLSHIILDKILLKDNKIADLRYEIIKNCDVVVDGRFIFTKLDANYHWAGSTNQQVIDIKETFDNIDLNEVVRLLEDTSNDEKEVPPMLHKYAYEEECKRRDERNMVIRKVSAYTYISKCIKNHES